jgi:tetratricopeptide (TPR) repeat protein
MGLAYEKLQKWDFAIDAYQRSIEFAPNDPRSYLHLGRVYVQMDRDKEAVEALLKAIEKDKVGIDAKEAKRLLDRVGPIR